MNLVYADEQGNLFDHPDYLALGRSGEMVVELLEDELIPLPEGATLVGLPFTRPVGLTPRLAGWSCCQENFRR